MYICPFCTKEFETEDMMSKHYMKCWSEFHSPQPSKDAPKSKDIETREDNQDILNFFNSFK